MAKQSISQKRAQRQHQENKALQQVFNVFLLGLAAECYMFIVYRNYVLGTVEQFLTWNTILEVLMIVGLVVLAAGAALFFLKRKDRKLCTAGLWTAAAGLFLGGSSAFAILFGISFALICIGVPIARLLGVR